MNRIRILLGLCVLPLGCNDSTSLQPEDQLAVSSKVTEVPNICLGTTGNECVRLGPPGWEGRLFVNVTDDLDDGSCDPVHCSLREAINASNALAGVDTIAFRIPGLWPYTIQPLSELPWVSDPTVIDGTTEPNFKKTPIVELDGSLSGGGNGLSVVAGNSTVRGLVIYHFDLGIWVAGGSGNVIEGNYVGTDVTGTVAMGNGEGIFIEDAAGNRVGGTTPQARNLVSGNFSNGISVNGGGAFGNRVEGNYVGTDVTGTAVLGNGNAGVLLGGSTGNVVGGTDPGAGNLISGNLEGVTFDGASENLVQGNYIGTDAGGAAALPNGTGILILGDANVIGGVDPAARNLISGNHDNAITLDLGAASNEIMGNLIGTDVTGTVALGNGGRGIWLSDAYSNIVGGGAEGAPNVISGNFGGITLTEGAHENEITGNFIGTDVSGAEALGNEKSGIFLSNGASDNAIGTRWDGSGNVIAFNGSGIRMVSTAASGNSVRRNSIFDNDGLGIDIGGVGVTDNDYLDEDGGPNDQQNFPVVEEVDPSSLAGYLHSTPETRFRVEFFASRECDPSGYGEGETFWGSMWVMTDENGDAGFEFFVDIPVGSLITATATGPDGSTSEFSACIPSA